MPRSNGIFSLIASYFATPGTTIRTEQHNPVLEDIAAALTDSLPRDGTAPMNGNLPMAGRRITNLGAATQPGDAARFDQVPADVSAWIRSLSGQTFAADTMPYATDATTAAVTALTEYGREILATADSAEARTALGLAATAVMLAATQAEAIAGTSNNTLMTPLRVAESTGANIARMAGQAIGAHVMARYEGADFPVSVGMTRPGADLLATNVNSSTVSGALPGTWACCGFATSASQQTRTTIWKRTA